MFIPTEQVRRTLKTIRMYTLKRVITFFLPITGHMERVRVNILVWVITKNLKRNVLLITMISEKKQKI